jgi:hypothetical protein
MMRDIDICDDDIPKVRSTAIIYSTLSSELLFENSDRQ